MVWANGVPPGSGRDEFAGPENTTVWLPPYDVAVFPHVSSAVTVSLNATPAVCVPGVGTEKLAAGPGLTVKLFGAVPLIGPCVAVSVVD